MKKKMNIEWLIFWFLGAGMTVGIGIIALALSIFEVALCCFLSTLLALHFAQHEVEFPFTPFATTNKRR